MTRFPTSLDDIIVEDLPKNYDFSFEEIDTEITDEEWELFKETFEQELEEN